MFSLDQAISDFVETPEFFEELKSQMALIKNPEKKIKLMEDLMSYKLSKLKTVDPEPEDRFRPISIRYTVSGQETTVTNGSTPGAPREHPGSPSLDASAKNALSKGLADAESGRISELSDDDL